MSDLREVIAQTLEPLAWGRSSAGKERLRRDRSLRKADAILDAAIEAGWDFYPKEKPTGEAVLASSAKVTEKEGG